VWLERGANAVDLKSDMPAVTFTSGLKEEARCLAGSVCVG
jgi:hypothetical protein